MPDPLIPSRLKELRQVLADPGSPDSKNSVLRIIKTYRDEISWTATSYFHQHYPQQSAARRLSTNQKIYAILLCLLLGFLLISFPVQLIITFNILFTGFCLLLLGLRVWLFKASVSYKTKREEEPFNHPSAELPVITILLPLYKEAASVHHLHQALQNLQYPREKLDIKFLLEEDDTATSEMAKQICTEREYEVIPVPLSRPRTKPKACNIGLWLARGEYIVIYDAEDRPEPDQLIKAARRFEKSARETACVQARLNYYNRQQNFLTRFFTLEYTLLFDILLPGLVRLGAPIPLGGTSNFFRTKTLQEIGGWDPHNVTEDADVGLRLAEAGYSSVMIDSTTWEEATPTLAGWLRQRSRWIKGYMQTWLVHMRQSGGHIFSSKFWLRHLTLQLIVGGVIVSALINPFFWLLWLAWLTGFPISVEIVFPPPLGAIATVSFLAGNLLLIYLYMAAPLQRRWHGLGLMSMLLPVYWCLQSIAGMIALWQFLVRPFYWEKTEHHPETDTVLQ